MVPGPQGPPGLPGASGNAYVHTQSSPSSAWTVVHNLGRIVGAACYDASNFLLLADVEYIDDNTVYLRFPSPVSGKVVCN